MQNLINDKPTKKSYNFIDTIRCISMMGIVGEHCLGSYDFKPPDSRYWAYIAVVQGIKFGTVIFFLLAGFLISDKFTDYSPGQYLKRRFATTFGPWLFWSVVFLLCFMANLHVKGRMYHDDRFNLHNILNEVRLIYLYTNYWFIINFMVSITILLLFKKYLYNFYFGGILLCFTLFYCINIHFEWMEPSHTTAILGFVFFLWLGAQLRKHWPAIEDWVYKTSYFWVIILAIITFGLSLVEITALKEHHSADPYNTLRFTNLLYSLVMFVLLLKIKDIKFIDRLKPRETTYGIYLIHYIIVIFVFPEIARPLHIEVLELSAAMFLLFKIFAFITVYLITWGMVMLISRSPAKRLVGN